MKIFLIAFAIIAIFTGAGFVHYLAGGMENLVISFTVYSVLIALFGTGFLIIKIIQSLEENRQAQLSLEQFKIKWGIEW